MTYVRGHYRRGHWVRGHHRRSSGSSGAGALVVTLIFLYLLAKSQGLAP